MKSSVIKALGVCAVLGFTAAIGQAQEGHPLKGSWIGEWQGNERNGDFVLVVLDWNGREVTGTINPGTDDIAIERATLDPEDWSVRLEAQDYVIEGNIRDLELPGRSIDGTWRHGDGRGNIQIVRQ